MDYIKTKIFSMLTIIAVFAAVIFFVLLEDRHERYVFFFKNSLNSKIETEVRYLLKQDIKPKEQAFMEDLILGPVNHDCYPFLVPDMKLRSCFSRNGVLYIDFPGTVMERIGQGFDSEDIAILLRKNIFTNFKDINKVSVFIEGKEIYELLKK